MAFPALLEVDVGFAKNRKSTGLAWYANSIVETALTGSTSHERKAALPRDAQFSIAALDAPIVPDEFPEGPRGCEYVFYGGAFWNRCRPGLSHHGRGRLLKEAGRQATNDFASVTSQVVLPLVPWVHPDTPILEAFPNTFMGVLIPEERYSEWNSALPRAKSDWLYETVVELGILRSLLGELDLTSSNIRDTFEKARHHDERAALICLLTAMFAHTGNAAIVGDPSGGWFWLPPIELWSRWATVTLSETMMRASRRSFRNVGFWGQQNRKRACDP